MNALQIFGRSIWKKMIFFLLFNKVYTHVECSFPANTSNHRNVLKARQCWFSEWIEWIEVNYQWNLWHNGLSSKEIHSHRVNYTFLNVERARRTIDSVQFVIPQVNSNIVNIMQLWTKTVFSGWSNTLNFKNYFFLNWKLNMKSLWSR